MTWWTDSMSLAFAMAYTVVVAGAVLLGAAYIVIGTSHRRRWWQYGECRGEKARRDRLTGEVQFIMWHKGDQADIFCDGAWGHKEDKWVTFDSYWWPQFVPGQKNLPVNKGDA